MAETETNVLLQAILAEVKDLRVRVGQIEKTTKDLAVTAAAAAAETSAIKTELGDIDNQVKEWIKKTEPVTKAYSDVPKVLRGVVATTSVVVVIVTAWWSGGIASVVRFLTQPPVIP